MQGKLFRSAFLKIIIFFQPLLGVFTFFGAHEWRLQNPPHCDFPRVPPNIPFSRCFFKKSLFFCPPSPVFLRVVISLRLPMVFNSSFMPGAFYKLYSHGLLARPPTDPACLNSICLHPRHIQPARNGLNPAFFPPFFPPLCPPTKPGWESRRGHWGWGAPHAPLGLFGERCRSSIPQVPPNPSVGSRCIISDGSLFNLNPKCITQGARLGFLT